MAALNAFVYRWDHKTNGKYYIGYHIGPEDDGYVCSSKIAEPIIKSCPDDWDRTIIFRGTEVEACEVESRILRFLDAKHDKNSYNQTNGDRYFRCKGHTKETRAKISRTLTGMKKPESMRLKLSARVSGRGNPMFGKPRTTEQRQRQSYKMSGLNNGNADRQIHSFVSDAGEIFTGTAWDFKIRYGIEQSSASHLIRGRYQSALGWRYAGLVCGEMMKANTQLLQLESK